MSYLVVALYWALPVVAGVLAVVAAVAYDRRHRRMVEEPRVKAAHPSQGSARIPWQRAS